MKLIVGLGNPGKKYEQTFHNVGFQVIDALSEFLKKNERANWAGVKRHALYSGEEFFFSREHGARERVVLQKPLTFMNESGRAVKEYIRYMRKDFDIRSDLWVVHDDGDIALGSMRIVCAKSSAGHRGVKSIIVHTGTHAFIRVRVGIRGASETRRTEEFVLKKPLPQQRKKYEAAIQYAAACLVIALEQGIEKAQMLFNKKSARSSGGCDDA